MSLLVVGTVAFDAIETPFGKTDKIVGGAATYISLSASYFTKKINLVSVVGDDFPAEAIQMLKDHRVDTEGLQIKKGEKTFLRLKTMRPLSSTSRSESCPRDRRRTIAHRPAPGHLCWRNTNLANKFHSKPMPTTGKTNRRWTAWYSKSSPTPWCAPWSLSKAPSTSCKTILSPTCYPG